MSLGAIAAHYVAAGGGATYATEVLADSPLFFLKLDETTGTTATDASGNAHDGTYVGSPTLGATGLVSDGGTAVTLNGSNQSVVVAGASWMNVTSYTVEVVFKTTATSGFILSRDNGTTQKLWDVQMTAGGFPQLTLFVGTTGTNFVSSVSASDGARHHLAISITPGATGPVMFLDGAAVASAATALGSLNTSTTDDITFGKRGNNSGFLNGTIDVPAYYGTALSATRIAAHAAAM